MIDYREAIKSEIMPFPFQKQVIFGALTCEKLIKNYEIFSKKFEVGQVQILQYAIGQVYQYAFNSMILTEQEILEIIDEIWTITPDPGDYGSIISSSALDACTSTISLLNFLVYRNIDCILDIVMFAYDTVHMFIQERDNLNGDELNLDLLIENDSLMIQEKNRQQKIINFLKNNNQINDDVLFEIRNLKNDNIIDLDFFK